MLPDHSDALAWLLIGASCALGVGLLARVRAARAVAALGFLACGVIVPLSFVSALLDAWPPALDPPVLLSIANAAGITVLGVWLCFRAVQVLLGRSWHPSLLTARLTGAALTAVAANHLWLARVIGADFASTDGAGLSVSISSRGSQFAGFPAWPIWHLGLGALALVLLAAPRRTAARAATALALWFACLAPLAAFHGVRFHDALVGPFTTILVLIPAYLAWWLGDELRHDESPPA